MPNNCQVIKWHQNRNLFVRYSDARWCQLFKPWSEKQAILSAVQNTIWITDHSTIRQVSMTCIPYKLVIQILTVQGESEYLTNLVLKWLKAFQLSNGLNFKWHLNTRIFSPVFFIVFQIKWPKPSEYVSGIMIPFEYKIGFWIDWSRKRMASRQRQLVLFEIVCVQLLTLLPQTTNISMSGIWMVGSHFEFCICILYPMVQYSNGLLEIRTQNAKTSYCFHNSNVRYLDCHWTKYL